MTARPPLGEHQQPRCDHERKAERNQGDTDSSIPSYLHRTDNDYEEAHG